MKYSFNEVKNLDNLSCGSQNLISRGSHWNRCHKNKIARTFDFLAESKSSRAGLNMHTWLSSRIVPWQKLFWGVANTPHGRAQALFNQGLRNTHTHTNKHSLTHSLSYTHAFTWCGATASALFCAPRQLHFQAKLDTLGKIPPPPPQCQDNNVYQACAYSKDQIFKDLRIQRI